MLPRQRSRWETKEIQFNKEAIRWLGIGRTPSPPRRTRRWAEKGKETMNQFRIHPADAFVTGQLPEGHTGVCPVGHHVRLSTLVEGSQSPVNTRRAEDLRTLVNQEARAATGAFRAHSSAVGDPSCHGAAQQPEKTVRPPVRPAAPLPSWGD